ncbi:MAG: putative dehydrogenase protein, partial [Thermomicrobiales bacterium]|nr:putative dehydrogenase protein [Thermomicrobiales bacterium]
MESPLPITQADAVVIGAGAFGLSAAYQLAAHGAGRVVVLDRFTPGSQTSPRAAGLYKLIQADETRTRLAQSSIEVIRGFSEATGIPLPFVQSGSVLAARTAEHAALIDKEA